MSKRVLSAWCLVLGAACGVRRASRLVIGAWCLVLGATCAAAEWDLGREGVQVKVECSPEQVDVARDFFVTVTATAPIPDLRDRFRGFSVAEDFNEDPVTVDNVTTYVSRWRLVPEPCAKQYSLRPFVVVNFYTAPVKFAPPAARETVTGGMEVDPKKDLPPLSWKLVGICAAALAVLALAVALVWWTVKKIREAIRVHRMSPIQRAMYELEKLLGRGLPGRGLYKDFYVELTMVVRRYVERRHAVRAPNLTTEEFLRAAEGNPAFTREAVAQLKTFLESADMVKFAGVQATPEMADAATDKARDYLAADDKSTNQKPETRN